MYRKSVVFILVPICLLLTSCLSWWSEEPQVPLIDAAKPSQSLEAVKAPAEKAKTGIKTAADLIVKSVDGIKDANRDISGGVKGIKDKDAGGAMAPEISEITQAVLNTIEHLKGLESAGTELTEAERNILELSALLSKAQGDALTFEKQSAQKDELIKGHAEKMSELEKQITELKNENAEALRSKLYYLIIAGVLGLAVAAWMFIQGNPRAIAMGAAAVVLIVGALAVSFFFKGFAIVGFVVIAPVFALIFWKGYCDFQDKKQKAKEERANKELVKTVEHIKDNIDDETKVRLFGGRVDDGEVGILQSEETKELVRSNRAVLKKEFDPIT